MAGNQRAGAGLQGQALAHVPDGGNTDAQGARHGTNWYAGLP
jgi:hypothetical protein